jgi:hypothetical protein
LLAGAFFEYYRIEAEKLERRKAEMRDPASGPIMYAKGSVEWQREQEEQRSGR